MNFDHRSSCFWLGSSGGHCLPHHFCQFLAVFRKHGCVLHKWNYRTLRAEPKRASHAVTYFTPMGDIPAHLRWKCFSQLAHFIPTRTTLKQAADPQANIGGDSTCCMWIARFRPTISYCLYYMHKGEGSLVCRPGGGLRSLIRRQGRVVGFVGVNQLLPHYVCVG